jgi:hypothetical protein
MKTYGGVDVWIHIFLTSALAGGEWSASRLYRFTLGERAPGTHWIGGWVDPRAGLDDMEKRKILPLPGLELRPLGRPARRQSLYRLRYQRNRYRDCGDEPAQELCPLEDLGLSGVQLSSSTTKKVKLSL